jgi:hypothetical protein
MFKSPGSRTALRASVATAIAVLATLKASIGGGLDAGEVVDLVTVAFVSAGAWLGIGALTPTEPFFGTGTETPVEVPAEDVKPV